jgi:hypothetical protein
MQEMELENSIYDSLLSTREKLKYKIIDDVLIPGKEELLDSKWQQQYISQYFHDRRSYPFLFVVVKKEDGSCVARFITFGFDVYRVLWISVNHKRTLGALDEFVKAIVN